MKRFLVVAALGLSGCAELGQQSEAVVAPPPAVANDAQAAPPPPSSARTVEEFDTTTEAQRAAATVADTGGRLLGTEVASLGDPSRPGFWIETALAKAPGKGRLVYPVNGKAVEVELLPLESGSARVSLAAFRLLEAPLTGLPVLEVHAN